MQILVQQVCLALSHAVARTRNPEPALSSPPRRHVAAGNPCVQPAACPPVPPLVRCASRIPNSIAESRIETTLRGAWRLASYNEVRSHASLKGHTPSTFVGGHMVTRAELNNVRWVSHCTAGTWSSSQRRPDNEFETDSIRNGRQPQLDNTRGGGVGNGPYARYRTDVARPLQTELRVADQFAAKQ